MNLRPLQLLGLVFVAMMQADCIPDCPPDPCEELFDPLQWCVTSNICRLNGQLMTCPDCTLSTIAPGNTLEIPFDEIWPLLGHRNDFVVTWDWGLTRIEIFLDGVPATEEQCKREPYGQWFKLTCMNLPRSLTRLGIKYTGGGDTTVEAFIRDQECEDAHPVCAL